MITLSMIGKSYINGQAVFVEQESASFPVNIPSHKVEKGINITDHVELQPRSVSISGLLVRPTKSHVETILEYFRTCQNKGTLVTYQGRRIYTNMLISDLSIEADSTITNGYKITSLLQHRMRTGSIITLKSESVNAKLRVRKGKHTGGNTGDAFYTEVEALF